MTRAQLRRFWLQLHKWIGLALAILIIPLTLSGSLLVWDHALDHVINPERYAVSGTTLLPASRYVTAAKTVLKPDQRLMSLTYPEGSGPVIVAAASTAGVRRAGPPVRISVWLDPPTARVLGVADNRSGALRFIHRLHGSFLIPGAGRAIVGWIGAAMMLSCFTGLWLWWPTAGRWIRALRWRRRAGFEANLHHLIGFWIALPLFLLSLTGVLIAFPALTGDGHRESPSARSRPQPAAHSALSPDAVLSAARAAAPGRVASIAWPQGGAMPFWTVTVRPARGPERLVTLDDDDGTLSSDPARARSAPGLAGLARRIHAGKGLGVVWQLIIFVAGLMPTLLAVTGIIIWWRARMWRKNAAHRRAAATAQA